MKKVVFICKGNMFRSPVAKAFYNQLAKDGSRAESYGTWVEKEEGQGRKLSSYPYLDIMFNELKKYDLDIRDEYRNQLKEEYLKDADRIIVMTEREFIPDWLNNYKYEYWENIPNPDTHTVEFMEGAVKLLRERVVELIK